MHIIKIYYIQITSWDFSSILDKTKFDNLALDVNSPVDDRSS